MAKKQEQTKRKRSIWVPLCVTLLATSTVFSSGLAVYYALRKTSAKTYTVEMDLDGGYITGENSIKVLPDTKIGQLPTPFKNQMIFEYWTEQGSTEHLDKQQLITKDMKLVAHYAEDVQAVDVTLNLGTGGYLPGNPGVESVTFAVVKGTYVGELPTPKKNNFLFTQWTGADFTDQITTNLTLTANYKTMAGAKVEGGNRLLQFKSDENSKDDKAWSLTNAEGTCYSSATWTIVDKGTKEAISGLGIGNDGKVTWNNVTKGSYTATITGTAEDGVSESTDIGIVVTDSTYKITDGFEYKEVTADETTTATFKLSKNDKSYTENVTFELSDTSHSQISIVANTGVLTIAKLPVGTYKLDVIAKVNGNEKDRKTINIVSSNSVYTLSGGSLYNTAKLGVGGTGTAWILKKGTTQITADSWSVTNKDGSAAATGISVPSGVLTWTDNTPKGTYALTISAKLSDVVIASVDVSLVVSENTYALKDGTTQQSAKTTVDGQFAKAWNLYKDDTSKIDPSTVTWAVTKADGSALTETTITVDKGTLKWTAATKAGNYDLAITATLSGETNPAASVYVSLILTDNVYVISGPTHTIINDNVEGETTAFKITKDGKDYTNVTWSINVTQPDVGKIEWNTTDNKIKYGYVSNGEHKITVSAKDNANSVTTTFSTVLISNASTFKINGPETVNLHNGSTYQYSAVFTTNELNDAKIKWKTEFEQEAGGAGKIQISNNGLITLPNGGDDDGFAHGVLTITASESNTQKTATIEVKVQAPWIESDAVWTNYNNQWQKVDMDTACGTDPIKITDLSSSHTTTSIARENWNSPIIFGEDVTSIPANFLNGCTTFNQQIRFLGDGQLPGESKCLIIGDAFLSGCTSYNNGCDGVSSGSTLALPDKLQIIGDGFLENCTNFNNGQLSGELVVATFIPDNVTYIGEDFMWECLSFNQSMIIPDTVTHIGINFMYNNKAMTKTVNIPDAYVFDTSVIDHTLSTNDKNAACYKTGITIVGADKALFIEKFPNMTDETGVYFRNLKTGA